VSWHWHDTGMTWSFQYDIVVWHRLNRYGLDCPCPCVRPSRSRTLSYYNSNNNRIVSRVLFLSSFSSELHSQFIAVWVAWYQYLTELCVPVTQNRSSYRLRSSHCSELTVLSLMLSVGCRSFSATGPTDWNILPNYLRNPSLSIELFKRYLKILLVCSTFIRRSSALETFLCHCAM